MSPTRPPRKPPKRRPPRVPTPSVDPLQTAIGKAFLDTEQRLQAMLARGRVALEGYSRWKMAHPAPEPLPDAVADSLRELMAIHGAGN